MKIPMYIVYMSWSFNSLFQNKTQSHSRGEYNVYSTFQSHEPEFDYLKSLEIEEKINKIRWLPQKNAAQFLLSTNGKFIPHHNLLFCRFAVRIRSNPLQKVGIKLGLAARIWGCDSGASPGLDLGFTLYPRHLHVCVNPLINHWQQFLS